jgi:putative DNA methylase
MTQFRQPKKLIEVALPLDAINAASAREKSIRHGHPSTLHLWWARRPLAAARAVIFAQMVDDPSAWPELFPTEAAQEAERQRLFRLIEQLVQWENTTNEDLLRQAREEIWKSWRRTGAAVREEIENRKEEIEKRKEEIENRTEEIEKRKEERAEREWERLLALFDPDRLPAFHDPFAGGGALPLEAQRLGLESYASDLNPVAVLINKAMIEIPPKFAGMPPVGGRSEGREVRSEGREVRSEGREVRSEIGERGVRSEIGEEDALSGNDPLAESDGGSARSVSAGAAPAQGGNLRDALADHTGSNLGSGEHSGGLDPRIQQGQGAVPGGRPGIPGGSGDVADALRGPGLVPDARNEPAALDAGRGQSHVDNDAAETSRGLTSHSSLLFPLSYKGA